MSARLRQLVKVSNLKSLQKGMIISFVSYRSDWETAPYGIEDGAYVSMRITKVDLIHPMRSQHAWQAICVHARHYAIYGSQEWYMYVQGYIACQSHEIEREKTYRLCIVPSSEIYLLSE